MFRRIALLTTVATIACAGAGTSASTAGEAGEVAPKRDRAVIQADEMTKVQALNLYEVVQRIHPEWLKSRNSSTTGQVKGAALTTDTEVQVYIDSQRAGNIEILKTMAVRNATSLRYYSASDAQVRFGTGNLNGAIQVITAMK